MKRYVIGLDFGTLSGRAVLADALSGKEIASSVFNYPHAVMEESLPDGTPLPNEYALQHPQDYLLVLSTVIPDVLKKGGVRAEEVAGIGVDFTTCTMLPALADGTPLCFLPEYEGNPQAYVKLWKHHAAQAEAERVNAVAARRNEAWHARYCGNVSCEWAFPKILEILNRDPDVYARTERFFELGDWISLQLTGRESHSSSFAGYKWMWNEKNGFPDDAYFAELDPRLSGIIGTKVCAETDPMPGLAGVIDARGAALTGLLPGTPVSLPKPDAHAAMPALSLTGDGDLMLIVGTSGCQILNGAEERACGGICGYVKDSIIPGLYTYEAGQAAVGDAFDWFVRNCVPAADVQKAEQLGKNLHAYLRSEASNLRVGESGLVMLDWMNGNRNPFNRPELSGLVVGMTLQTRACELYRAVIESTAFGLKTIVDCFLADGLSVRRICAGGGIAKKDPMLMQIYADVLDLPISVGETDQAGALGSAIYAAVGAGLYGTVAEAAAVFAQPPSAVYTPIPANVEAYRALYREYCLLRDAFGNGEYRDMMSRLRALR